MELTREDYKKILDEVEVLLRENAINAAVYRSTQKLAIENLKKFPKLKKDKVNSSLAG